MANATLTSALNSGTTYTSLAVTAMPTGALVGETIWVSLTLTTVEGFTASLAVTAGDTTIHVTSQVAANNHLIGEQVAPMHTLTAVGRTATPIQTQRTHRI